MNRPSSATAAPHAPGIAAALRFAPGPALLCCAAAAALLAYAAAVLLAPVLRGADTYMSFARLYIWTAELQAGHTLSTWTPLDANGFGSPVPFFYHKLFNLAGAAFALASADIVSGYRLAILLFSALLCAGTYACARRLGCDRVSSAIAAAGSVFAPYLLQKLIAGSVAEYSAAALVPCVAALALDAYAGRCGPARGAALFALLVLVQLAHVLVFAIAAGVLIPALLWLCLRAPRKGAIPLTATVAATLVFATLIYVPFDFWGTLFCPDQAKLLGRIADLLLPPQDLVGRSRSGLGWPFPLLLAGMGAFALRRARRTDPRARAAFVLGCVSLALVLAITQLTRPLWLIPGPVAFIQFPWRLLAVATPLAIVAAAGLLESFGPATKRTLQLGALAFAALGAAQQLSVATRTLEPIPGPQLRREAPTTSIVGADAAGEYFPAEYRRALAGVNTWTTRVTVVLPPARTYLVEGEGCRYPRIPHPSVLHEVRFAVTCTDNGHLRVNQFATPFLEAVATRDDGALVVHPLRSTTFIDFALPPGRWTVTVRQRSWGALVALAWRAKLKRADAQRQ